MKLITNQKLKDLAGKELEVTVGKALSNIVLYTKKDPLRAYMMAQKLYSQDEIELDKVDMEWLKTAVTDHAREAFTNDLVGGQLLFIFSELKND